MGHHQLHCSWTGRYSFRIDWGKPKAGDIERCSCKRSQIKKMIEQLIKASRAATDVPSINEAFITLMRLCQQDSAVRAKVQRIVCLPPKQRIAVVNGLVQQLMISDAPNEFVMAITALLDESLIAEVCRFVD